MTDCCFLLLAAAAANAFAAAATAIRFAELEEVRQRVFRCGCVGH